MSLEKSINKEKTPNKKSNIEENKYLNSNNTIVNGKNFFDLILIIITNTNIND